MRFSSLLLVICLPGCAVHPPTVVKLTPPPSLMAPCIGPAWRPITNGELARYALELRSVLAACDDDKTALREWAKE